MARCWREVAITILVMTSPQLNLDTASEALSYKKLHYA